MIAALLASAWTVSAGAADAPEAPSAADVYEERTYTYTGGPYKDEVFKYRILKPAKVAKGKTYPLVLFLHGAGERGDDNRKQLKYLPERMAAEPYRSTYPCFVLAPQCRRGRKWADVSWSHRASTKMPAEPSHQMAVAIAVLRKTMSAEPVDPRRVYLTGLSMGGYGSWDLAVRHPEWFAAVVPICGGGDERQAKRLASLPIWAFHGDKDPAVPVGRSRTMIEAIKQAGGKPKYTEVKGGGHNVWSIAYAAESGVLEWMFRQVKPEPLPAGVRALVAPDSPLRKGERIAFLGDSITQQGVGKHGYVTLIRQAIESAKGDLGVAVIGAGISGHKVPDLQKRLDRDVIDKKATAVFVYIGINDVWHSLRKRGTPKDKYEAGLRDVIGRLKKSGATVVLATPSVIGEKHDGSNQLDAMLDEYAAISRKVAAETNVHLCDLRKAFVEYLKQHNPQNKAKGVLTRDGVHLNAAGNRFVADQAAAALAEALAKRK